ncbi:MAG: sulfate adenylyltransferase [Candidatus Caenarcaniphilales bacterium]|nr:sulfate adenylyltransferase [Candidatus Caenarcaniphilales bacterium]
MITPHGHIELISKFAAAGSESSHQAKANALVSLEIADRYISDCELIANGGYTPVKGFFTREDVLSCINDMQLPCGTVWAIPLLLPVSADQHQALQIGQEIALRNDKAELVAFLKISDKYKLDLEDYCQKVYKTTDPAHPGVKNIFDKGDCFVGGEIFDVLLTPPKAVAERYYLSPTQTRAMIAEKGWNTVVAFQTRNPIHRAHEYLIKCALESLDGVLIHPLVGETKSDDIPADTRMACYEALVSKYFSHSHTLLSVLPATMHYAGPREAIHHMIMRSNYGCTHMIIGRDHAGVGSYYGTYEAQELVENYADRLSIKPVKFEHSFYCATCGNMASQKTCPHPTDQHLHLSGTKVRNMLQEGIRPPAEFSRPEVADILIQWARQMDSKAAFTAR